MEPVLLLTGAAVGFVVAAPAGPAAALCVQRTLLDGRWVGLGAGAGAAVGDTVFGALALLSVAVAEGFLQEHRTAIQLSGSLALIALGAVTALRSRRGGALARAAASEEVDSGTILHAFAEAFAATVVNPITVVAFLSIFAALGVSERTDGLLDSWLVVAGVFAGAALWWGLLASAVSMLRHRFTGKGLAWTSAVCGFAILGFGAYGLIDLALRWPA